MKKFRLMLDKDKETAWLNEMAAEGYALKSFFAGLYDFEETEKGKYVYQIDMTTTFGKVTDDYRTFMEETGVEVVQSWGYWVILRKLAAEGAFQLYTDVDSQIEHYTRILTMFKVVTIFEMLCLFVTVVGAAASRSLARYGSCCLVFAIVLSFVNITFRTRNHIAELKDEIGVPRDRNDAVSMKLTIGLLLNAVALLGADGMISYVKYPIQLAAVVLMLWGIYETAKNRKTE